MKMKLSTLLFGLLLAVGWTSNAFAQEATYKASDIRSWTYDWVDANGVTQTSYYIDQETGQADQVTDPYQMYGMLRAVYMDKRFPGPTYTAYSNSNARERKVYYGGIEGGWEIGLNTEPLGNITITPSNNDVGFQSITVRDGNQVITSWTSSDGTTLPSGWSGTMSFHDGGWFGSDYYYTNGSIVIPSSLLAGHNSVQVVINARDYATLATRSISVNGSSQNMGGSYSDHTWTINAQSSLAPDGTYTPNAEGYTALVVAVNNTTVTTPYNYYNGYDSNNAISTFTSKAEIIQYFTDNVAFVKLLTDGMRIGSDDDYTRGTVFNCDGTYNKFFFLSKGQSRQKDAQVLALQNTYGLMGEDVPFKEMFEEFSPTAGDANSQITDFYSKMMEGSVYNVVHDCASVIHAGHQFSMSGNSGTTAYPLSGLNFFIPDYRLKYWETRYSNNTVDGRTMNPYINAATGNTFRDVPCFCSNFAQYNQLYAPKVGIYMIHLHAEAVEVAQDHTPGNRNYRVTLEWTSSLNEMAGRDVPQIYTVYYYDDDGQLQYVVAEGITDGKTGLTTVSYLVEQFAHSYTISYIIKGQPNDSDHPSFIAWSNTDGVVIPGWADFVGLDLDHFESDFVTTELKNWYRNFMLVTNDVGDGLTVSKVSNGMNTFNVYRYDAAAPAAKTPIATLTFDQPTTQQVRYTVNYVDETQKIKENKYQRSAMDIPDQGYVRVKGNGDLVIWPNGYWVNFKRIVVKNNGQTITSWTNGNLPGNWGISDGSVWVAHTTDAGDNVHYIEGGGYIYIPNILNNENYNNLTVEITAYADGANTAKITVNDVPKNIANTPQTDPYVWNSLSPNAFHAPMRAPESQTITFSQLGLTNQASLNGQTITAGDVNMTFAQGSANNPPAYYNNGQNLRIYSGNTMTISSTRTITSIDFTFATANNSNYAWSTTCANTGTYSGNNSNGTWSSQVGADNIVFTNNKTGGGSSYNQVRIVSMVVTFAEQAGPVEGGLLRLALPIVDQFNVDIPADNKHPEKYGYVLKYEPQEGDTLESGNIEVPVLHTKAVVNGYYTEEQVMADKDRSLDIDMMSADVTLDLPVAANPTPQYVRLQGGLNVVPEPEKNKLSELFRRSAGDYREIEVTSPLYVEDDAYVYPAGTVEYFNSNDVTTGVYAENYISYAPSITADGIARRYYEDDHLSNSYGGPIWVSSVGKVELSGQVEQSSNSIWSTWTYNDGENDVNCTLYRALLNLDGYLPKISVPKLSNPDYEPFMFRVWVKCDDMRKFKIDQATGRYVDDGPVGSDIQLLQAEEIYWDINQAPVDNKCSLTYGSVGDNGNGPSAYNNNLVFGAPVNSKPTYIVRFYYKTKKASAPNRLRGDNDEVPMYYVVESEFTPDQIPTGVIEILNQGEVVSKTYYNAQGMESDKPFKGVNIVVTRFSDGTTSVSKVVR